MERGSKMRVLYAEDVKETREIYQEVFINAGYDVSSFENGDQALEAYKYGKYDLLILDVDLPGKGGDDILQWLRQRGDLTPVIILSGKNKYTLMCKEYEANDYIHKGCNFGEIVIRIEKVLRNVWGDDMVDRLTDRISFDRKTFILAVDNEKYFLKDRAGTICSIFCSNKNKGISLENLCLQLWNHKLSGEDDPKIAEMRTYISKIRKLVERDPRIKLYKIRDGDYILSITSNDG